LRALCDRSKGRCIRIARALAVYNNVTDGAHATRELLATLDIYPDVLSATKASAANITTTTTRFVVIGMMSGLPNMRE